MSAITSSINTRSQMRYNQRGCLYYVKRGLVGLVALLITLPITGFLYESVMSPGDLAWFPALGAMLQVEGRNMHLRCTAEGSPTVIFEAGLGAWSDAWSQVQPEVGAFARACSYDRAGMGWSEPSDTPRTPEQIATELHALLVAADIQPPYILVGHSLGGKSIRLFAERFPEAVAGLVFVDARHESVEPVGRTSEQNAEDRAAFESSLSFYRVLRQFGIARLFGVPLARTVDPSTKALPDELVYRLMMFTVRETTLQTLMAESTGSTANDEQLRAAQLPDDLPVFVLTADSSMTQLDGWETGQQNLVALSSNNRQWVVQNSSHNMQADQPQPVVDAVRAVIESVRTGEPLEQ